MAVPEHIKRLAKEEGFPEVRNLERRWNNYDLYSAFDPEGPYVGLPQIILAEGDTARWANPEETEAILASSI